MQDDEGKTEWRVGRYCTVVRIMIEVGLVIKPKLEDEKEQEQKEENTGGKGKNKIRPKYVYSERIMHSCWE